MIHIWSLDGRVVQGGSRTSYMPQADLQSLIELNLPICETPRVNTMTQLIRIPPMYLNLHDVECIQTSMEHDHPIVFETFHGMASSLPSCRHAGR